MESIRWFFPLIGESEIANTTEVLRSGYINDGNISRAFEQKVANFLGCKHCVTVTSGTAALALGLIACGIGYGDEVIVPDFTFIATANAVRLVGANVKLVDIEPLRFCIDTSIVEKAITSKTKAIIAVDVNGRGCDYQKLEAICKKKGLFLICDSAEALGSKFEGKYLGTYGDVGCFSFSANKTVSSGQGGMLATNNTSIYERVLELKDQGRRYGGSGGDDVHPVLGFNFKYTNIQAAVACAQFEKIHDRINHFQKRDSWYLQYLPKSESIYIPPMDINSGEVRQWSDILFKDRYSVEQAFKQNKIEFRSFWFPLHRQNPYLADDQKFPNSIQVSQNGLWLPSSFVLTEDDVKFVSSVIKNVCVNGSIPNEAKS